MLHKIYLPGCVVQLEQIRQFQRDILAFACSSKATVLLTESILIDTLGTERGSWLWIKLWKQRGDQEKTAFHLALLTLIKHVQKRTDVAQDIINAFDHDATFHVSLDDPKFIFQFNFLEKATREALKPFMILFYEDLLTSGFETPIHGQSKKLDRDAFIESFWENNTHLKVCPACDRQKSEKVDNKVYDDADHFLPKSKYPFLSLHHENLVPLCIYCNRSFKGNRDSIDRAQDAPLLNIFHPYQRPALEHLDILVSRNKYGVVEIRIQDKAGIPSRRVENLKRVFQLHKRWPAFLIDQIEDIRDEIANAGIRICRYKGEENLTEQELKVELESMLKQRKRKIGRKLGYVLQISYLVFVLQNRKEFEELFKDFIGWSNRTI